MTTHTPEITRLREVNADLLECVQAALSFLEDRSLSERRRQACLQGFRSAIAKATQS